MNKTFNDDFKILHDRYTLNSNTSDEVIKSIILSMFYSRREPLKKIYDDLDDELGYLLKLLDEYTTDRKMALQIYKRLCNHYGWDLESYESEYKDEKLEYIYQRDSHITIILFFLNCYSLVENDIADTNSAAFFLRHAIRIEEQLNLDGFGLGSEVFENFIECIYIILDDAKLIELRRHNLIKAMEKYKESSTRS